MLILLFLFFCCFCGTTSESWRLVACWARPIGPQTTTPEGIVVLNKKQYGSPGTIAELVALLSVRIATLALFAHFPAWLWAGTMLSIAMVPVLLGSCATRRVICPNE